MKMDSDVRVRPRADGPNAEMAKRRAARKQRGSVDHGDDQRLSVAGANLDHANYAYRWVNDEPGRLASLRSREWEEVAGDELNGVENARHAGMSREGKPMKAVLMKKYRPWFEEDAAQRLSEHRELERDMQRGRAPQQVEAQERAGGKFYAKSENRISFATPALKSGAGDYNP